MSRDYGIELNYLEHDGGTKFYETVLINEEGNGLGANSPAILIQRWGKITQNTGGGSTKISKGTLRQMMMERDKVLTDKGRAKPGKGQYLPANFPSFGLGRLVMSGKRSTVDATDLAHVTNQHYTTDDENTILNYFAISGISEDDGIVEEGIDNEPDRGGAWASW